MTMTGPPHFAPATPKDSAVYMEQFPPLPESTAVSTSYVLHKELLPRLRARPRTYEEEYHRKHHMPANDEGGAVYRGPPLDYMEQYVRRNKFFTSKVIVPTIAAAAHAYLSTSPTTVLLPSVLRTTTWASSALPRGLKPTKPYSYLPPQPLKNEPSNPHNRDLPPTLPPTNPGTLTTFHPFPRLPRELRRMIWKETDRFTEPRIIDIQPVYNKDPGNTRCYNSNEAVALRAWGHPLQCYPMLFVHWESRLMALEHLEVLIQDKIHVGRKVYFNPKTDLVRFVDNNTSKFVGLNGPVNRRLGEALGKIQNLVLKDNCWTSEMKIAFAATEGFFLKKQDKAVFKLFKGVKRLFFEIKDPGHSNLSMAWEQGVCLHQIMAHYERKKVEDVGLVVPDVGFVLETFAGPWLTK